MRKLIGIVFIVLLMFSFVYAETNSTITNETIAKEEKQRIEKENQAIYNSIENHSVQIFTLNPELGFCTGTVLSNENDATVLTCKHCITPEEETWADNVKVKLVITSATDDLAYLIMDGNFSNKISAKLGIYREPIGSKVYFYGQPGLITQFSSNGAIVRYTDDWGWIKMPIIPGCSGSGIFNRNKELIGVAWGNYKEGGMTILFWSMGGEDVSVFEPISDIQKFLKEVEDIRK